ncbi:MAG TPA: carboxypeptidase-like regulatory domain-containing protein [Terracidiphilus sp.]
MTRFRIALACSLLPLLLVVTTIRLHAQASTSLNGRVTDHSGAVIAGATVKLTLEATGAVRESETSDTGQYQFSQLVPGRYTLSVSAPGFATDERKGMDLLVSQPATANVELKLGAVTAQVTVSSAAQEMLNTTDATLGNAFDANQVASLPLDQRNVPDLLSLQPGVTFLGRSDDVSGTQGVGNNPTDSRAGSVNGGRSDQSNITLDGVDVNDINNGYAFTSVLRTTQDSVAEFRVTTSNPNAEEGRSSGAQVALVTRSGSNAFHGAAYEYNRSNLLEANDFFNKQQELAASLPNRPESLVRNIYGAAVGGPVLKDRLFFFLNYEGRRDSQGTSVNAGLVPTASYRAGNLSYEYLNSSGADSVFTLTPADIQSMDPQGIGNDAALLKVLNNYPQGNDPTQGDGLNSIGYRFPYTIHRKYDTYVSRIDWNAGHNGKHTFFWRGNLQNDSEPSTPAFPGQAPQTTVLTNNKGFAAGYTLVISTSMVNDLRYGLTRQGVSSSGAANQPLVFFSEVAQPGSTNYSTSFIIPVHNVVDNLSWTKHNHNLAFGTDLRFLDDQRVSNAQSFPDGQMNQGWLTRSSTIANSNGPFDPQVYGFPAVDFANYGNEYNSALMNIVGTISEGDAVYNYTKTGSTLAVGAPLKRDYRWNEYEFYGQDTWRVSSALTLTYGLRYSYLQAPAETSGTQVGTCQFSGSVCQPYSLTKYFNGSLAQANSGGAANNIGEVAFNLNGRYNHAPDFWSPDKYDIGPRLAVAFSPAPAGGFWKTLLGNQQTSVRAGYSMVFDHFGAAIVQNFDTTGSYGLSSHLSNAPGSQPIESAPRFTSINSVPQSLLPTAPPGGFPAVPAASGNGSFAISWGLDSAIKTPYSHLFDFSLTRALQHGASLEVSYVGRFAHRQLAQEDVAMPINLMVGGSSYFAAARQMAQMARANTPVSSVASVPYWQQVFGGLEGQDVGLGYGALTATQNVYALFLANLYNETYALYQLDTPGSLPNSNIGAGVSYPAFRFYHDQYSALYSWRSIGYSNFNALEAVYRQHFGGLQADFNYTYSKSLDITSQAERLGNSAGINYAQIMNTWAPNQLYGPSDYDVRHQLNSNFVCDLPIGTGKSFLSHANRLTNELVGGWQTTGIVRWTSGFPFEMNNGAYYPTNWDIQGYGEQVAPIPSRANGRGKLAQRFADPAAVFASFAHALPGQSGSRNPLRGDGFFDWDQGVNKTLPIKENVKLILRWDMFNVSNSVRFDPQSISSTLDGPQSFGEATALLTNYRLAQFAARLEF